MAKLNDVRRYYAQLNDESLLELAREAGTFTPEALAELQIEITNRKLEKADSEAAAYQVGDFAPRCDELISPMPAVYDDARPKLPERPEGSVRKVVRITLLISKISIGIIYIALAILMLVAMFLDPHKLGVDRLLGLNGGKIWRLILVSIVINLLTWAFLALRFARGVNRPISVNGILLICLAYTVAFSLVASAEVLGDEFPVAKWIWNGGNLAFLWLLFVLRIRQVKFIKSSELRERALGFLLLRSFRFDNLLVADNLNPFLAGLLAINARLRWIPLLGEMLLDLTYDLRYAWTYESLLRSRLEGRGGSPIAASLYNPKWKGVPPVCGTFIKVDLREDWRAVVKYSFECVQWIIILPGESAGLLEELRFLRYGDFPVHRIILLIPENTPADLRAAFSETLRGIDCNLADTSLEEGELYTFDSNWAIREIARGLETYRDAVLEIQAWSIFGGRPDTAWCEFDNYQVQPTPLGRCPNCGLVIDLVRTNTLSYPDQGPGFPRPALPFPVWEPLPSVAQRE